MKKKILTVILTCILMIGIIPLTRINAAKAPEKIPEVEGLDPSIPQVIGASYHYNSIYLVLNHESGNQGIEVYRATSKDGKYSLVKEVIINDPVTDTSTNIHIDRLTTDKKYYFKIRTYSIYEGNKKRSKFFKFEYTPRLDYITNLDIKVNNPNTNTYTLSWSDVNGADGYVLYRAKENGTFKKIKSIKRVSDYSNYYYYHYTTSTKNDYTYRIRPYRKVNKKYVYGAYTYQDATWKYLNGNYKSY